MVKEIAPYGFWPSGISAGLVAGQSVRFGFLQSSGDWIYWTESRPEEAGRAVLMRGRPGHEPQELLAAPYSARSKVHEYGGGEFLVAGDRVFFSNDADQDVYTFRIDQAAGADTIEAPERLTAAPDMRFADFAHDPAHDRLIAVCERARDGSGDGDHQYPENMIVSIGLEGDRFGHVEVLVRGRDFYACPRVRQDGTMICWVAWDLPDMPWEQASLHVGGLGDDGLAGAPERIAGGDGVSVFQPEWSRKGDLLFISDASGWGNLYKWDGAKVERVVSMEAECGRPHWVFGMRSYAESQSGNLGIAALEEGEVRFMVLDRAGGVTTPRAIETGFTSIENVNPTKDGFVAQVTTAEMPAAIAVFDGPGGATEIIRQSADVALEGADISVAKVIGFEGDGGDLVYGQYYPPASKDWSGPDGELPPVIVMVHGGPSGMAQRGFQWKVQYWTNRGFGVFDLDYSGSTGYGRAYRKRLDGQWGVRDVADVVAAGRYLAGAGLADPGRLLVSGGSAGGYGVLMALAAADLFAAGACYYGISDLVQLLKFTHKFEGGYLFGLTGTGPDDFETVLRARSPLSHIDRMTSPLIVFQGLDDKVVPPEQSRMIVDGLKARGVAVEYHEFEGEGHGFRKGATIKAALEAEAAFYRRVFEG